MCTLSLTLNKNVVDQWVLSIRKRRKKTYTQQMIPTTLLGFRRWCYLLFSEEDAYSLSTEHWARQFDKRAKTQVCIECMPCVCVCVFVFIVRIEISHFLFALSNSKRERERVREKTFCSIAFHIFFSLLQILFYFPPTLTPLLTLVFPLVDVPLALWYVFRYRSSHNFTISSLCMQTKMVEECLVLAISWLPNFCHSIKSERIENETIGNGRKSCIIACLQ